MTASAEEWPPPVDTPKGDVAWAVMRRLQPEFGPSCVRQTSANLTEDGWAARVGMWPYSPEVVSKVEAILDPVTATVFPHPEMARPARR